MLQIHDKKTHTHNTSHIVNSLHSPYMWVFFPMTVNISGWEEMFVHCPNNMYIYVCVYKSNIYFYIRKFDKSYDTVAAAATDMLATIIKIKLRVREYFCLKNRNTAEAVKITKKKEHSIHQMKLKLHWTILNGKRNGNATNIEICLHHQRCKAIVL